MTGRDETLAGPVLAELCGTAFLLAIVVGSGIMGERLADGNDAVALLANSLATGAGLTVLIWALGPVSGAHFNPVVTLLAATLRELPWSRALAYLAAQVTGAVAGVFAAHGMFALPWVQYSTTARDGVPLWGAEFIATIGLLGTIRLVGRRQSARVAPAVGLYILSAYWFTASTSFANPAVTFARAFTNTFSGIAPASVPGFWLAQLLALGLAVVVLRR
jgi:glycerol uptake facilitator-like aquaporin